MILFYTNDIQGDYAVLGDEEARHCTQVLRKKVGDTIRFVDGLGTLYDAILSDMQKKKCGLKITKTYPNYNARDFHLHIAIAPTKNMDRLEWFVEKATEIGVDEITPIICSHSERRKLRTDRLLKKAIGAMKQSLKATLPIVNELTSFKQALRLASNDVVKLIAQGKEKQSLKDNYPIGKAVYVLVGPEGDFSKEELQLAFEHGFKGVHLGKSRLRTETAGLVVCHTLNFLNH